ncbi:hypothetical protein [Streptomyces sp. UNOC14_S4]|uniref:hypothetical protein n=1 Tax=Streptomyces sp. UNOC14_S4 TaxID=2872340 RepID=UPI001E5DB4ED|nr:hypothetical protein [Streptomyces sp. UNOC14_S4]MCC3766853.1 hypothetical protein [Streptomyces sp. UNOC14_S4]
MPVTLHPDSHDPGDPEVSLAWWMFHAFQDRLAAAEGFTPLIDLPEDDGGQLPPDVCAQLLPRLEALVDRWRQKPDPQNDPLLPRHTEIAAELVAVLRVCVAKDVELSIW